jgi:hypothetical protein
MGLKAMPTPPSCTGHTEYADVSASTPAVPEHYGHEERLPVLHHGHTEYADASASTPAVAIRGHEEHVYRAAMDTQSMLMSQPALGSSPEHQGTKESTSTLPLCAALRTRVALAVCGH